MPEQKIYSKGDLVKIFLQLGIKSNMSLMVHSSLSGLGYVVNGPYDIIDALLELIGPGGTLLVPSHSGDLTDPQDWKNPPVPQTWVKKIKQKMNPFDPKKTPVRNRGILPQYFLNYPEVRRSYHPISSVAAIGRKADYYTCGHPLHESEGVGSPCYKLFKDGGYILLLGVSLEACTGIHVAEFIADCSYLYQSNLKVLVDEPGGRRAFVRLKKYPGSSEWFIKLRKDLLSENKMRETQLDDYRITFFKLADAVGLAVKKLEQDESYFRIPES
ncbi:MAG: AAC(3) family N-acetyltransferase [Thermodesulfobacteriota bacterium]